MRTRAHLVKMKRSKRFPLFVRSVSVTGATSKFEVSIKFASCPNDFRSNQITFKMQIWYSASMMKMVRAKYLLGSFESWGRFLRIIAKSQMRKEIELKKEIKVCSREYTIFMLEFVLEFVAVKIGECLNRNGNRQRKKVMLKYTA